MKQKQRKSRKSLPKLLQSKKLSINYPIVNSRIVEALSKNNSTQKNHKNVKAHHLITSRDANSQKKYNKQNKNNQTILEISSQLLHNQSQLNQSFFTTNLKSISSHNRQHKQSDRLLKIISTQRKFAKEQKQKWVALQNKICPEFMQQNHAFHDQRRYTFKAKKDNWEQLKQNCFVQVQTARCFEGCFPLARKCSSMVMVPQNDNLSLYLTGGLSSELGHRLNFHKLDRVKRQWIPIQNQNKNAPRFNLSQHCLASYKKTIYIIGGISLFPNSKDPSKNQRYNIPFISYYRTHKQQWNRINWNIYLRAHSCCVISRFLIIDGGINEHNKHNQKLYAMDLELEHPPLQLAQGGLKLAYHKIISTDKIEESVRNSLKSEGLFCYGGRHKDGSVNKNIYFCEIDTKLNQRLEKINKLSWVTCETVGAPPPARYSHSLNVVNIKNNAFQKKSYMVVIGGRDSDQQVLHDVWAMNFQSNEWCEIMLSTKYSLLSKGICQHATDSCDNRIYIFGGTNSQHAPVTQFWSLSFEKNYRNGKMFTKVLKKKPLKPNQSTAYIQIQDSY